jgi:hypothetical protein
MKLSFIGLLVTIFMLSLTTPSCSGLEAPAGLTIEKHGFGSGFSHGLVFFYSYAKKLLGYEYTLTADNNTGLTYYLGFGLGFILSFIITVWAFILSAPILPVLLIIFVLWLIFR